MDVGRAPSVVRVPPGVRPRLDGEEAVFASVVRQHPPESDEVGVDGGVVEVAVMEIAPRGVALPDLDEGPRDRSAVLVEEAAGDDDPLPKCLTRPGTGKVGERGAGPPSPEGGAGRLADGVR